MIAPRAALALTVLLSACNDSTGPGGSSGQGFTITVRYVDRTPPAAAVVSAFNVAAAKWRSIIVDSVGSVPVQLAAGACDSSQPAINERVKDLLILVHVREISDTVPGQSILGESGPCLVRDPGNIPVLGVMSLNSATLTSLAGSGLLDDVVKHELAHLLVFGTVWDLDHLLQDSTTDNPWFSGAEAEAAFHAADPRYSDKVVPVESGGGAGTTLSHWRESVMTNELMTGFIDNPGPNPLSAITIESMADLGYSVDVSQAEPWPTPGSGMSPAVTGRPAPASVVLASAPHTVLRSPRFAVTRSGAMRPLSSR